MLAWTVFYLVNKATTSYFRRKTTIFGKFIIMIWGMWHKYSPLSSDNTTDVSSIMRSKMEIIEIDDKMSSLASKLSSYSSKMTKLALKQFFQRSLIGFNSISNSKKKTFFILFVCGVHIFAHWSNVHDDKIANDYLRWFGGSVTERTPIRQGNIPV